MLNVMVYMLMALRSDRKGVSSLEYGILAAALIGAVFAAVTALGTEIGTLFNAVVKDLQNATTSS